MSVTKYGLPLRRGQLRLPFLVGSYQAVVGELSRPPRQRSLSILPCTLYDLARVTAEAEIAAAYAQLDWCTTDGMPLVWWLRRQLPPPIERVYGPDVIKTVLAAQPRQKHLILCPSPAVAGRLAGQFVTRLQADRLRLEVVGDSRNSQERERLAQLIRDWRPDAVWIGVGSPNQVLLATYFKSVIARPTTYWCVGAAIPFLAGMIRQAPRWMQQRGLEWFFRLLVEPRRLWQRYLVVTPWFLSQLALSWFRQRFWRRGPRR